MRSLSTTVLLHRSKQYKQSSVAKQWIFFFLLPVIIVRTLFAANEYSFWDKTNLRKSYRETRGEEEIAKREQVNECLLSESDPKSTDIRPALPPAGVSRGEG